MPKQLIEQTRFASVGPADDRGADTTAQDATFVGGGEELVDEVQRIPIGRGRPVVRRDVFIGKIKRPRWASTFIRSSRNWLMRY